MNRKNTNPLPYKLPFIIPAPDSPEFAHEMLRLELTVQLDIPTLDQINELLELYQKAVEHHVKNDSHYFIHFINKIKELLLNKNVICLIEREEKKRKRERRLTLSDINKELKINNTAIVRSKNLDLTKQQHVNTQEEGIKEMIQSYSFGIKEKNKILNKSLVIQKNSLCEKLKKRKAFVSRLKTAGTSELIGNNWIDSQLHDIVKEKKVLRKQDKMDISDIFDRSKLILNNLSLLEMAQGDIHPKV